MEATEHHYPSIPDDVTSPRAKLVYLALALTAGATASELQRLLSIEKLTLLRVLRALSDRDLVHRTGTTYHCT